eukprot:10572911-Lingulodinium_polyedra.AAC.1
MEGMAAGCGRACELERAAPRLLLAPVPRSVHLASEVMARVGLWQRQEFEELLLRVEAQRLRRSTP